MKARDQAGWERILEVNTGHYESSILRFAERWAGRMEARLEWEKVEDVAEETIDEPELCLTNFQLAQAVVALWEHGEALKAWYNAEWTNVKLRRCA